ncbi:beta/gamma crystallin domain-containing protein 1 [Xyrauchen texanus]|uniref:beta/gamma crystallin domain-containing protein 1 n=1 Tax=Xyrauchen texanus TaxID=154827 RepID=UPI0022425022|nr:beta/gamma crystallin domain-containing protein 1 [Xyrauchen texanus]
MGRRRSGKRRRSSHGDGGGPKTKSPTKTQPSSPATTRLATSPKTAWVDSSFGEEPKAVSECSSAQPPISPGASSYEDTVQAEWVEAHLSDDSADMTSSPDGPVQATLADIIDCEMDEEPVMRLTETPESKRRSLKVSHSEKVFAKKVMVISEVHTEDQHEKFEATRDTTDLKLMRTDNGARCPEERVDGTTVKSGHRVGRIADKISLFESRGVRAVNRSNANLHRLDISPARKVSRRLREFTEPAETRSSSAPPSRTVKERALNFNTLQRRDETFALPFGRWGVSGQTLNDGHSETAGQTSQTVGKPTANIRTSWEKPEVKLKAPSNTDQTDSKSQNSTLSESTSDSKNGNKEAETTNCSLQTVSSPTDETQQVKSPSRTSSRSKKRRSKNVVHPLSPTSKNKKETVQGKQALEDEKDTLLIKMDSNPLKDPKNVSKPTDNYLKSISEKAATKNSEEIVINKPKVPQKLANTLETKKTQDSDSQRLQSPQTLTSAFGTQPLYPPTSRKKNSQTETSSIVEQIEPADVKSETEEQQNFNKKQLVPEHSEREEQKNRGTIVNTLFGELGEPDPSVTKEEKPPSPEDLKEGSSEDLSVPANSIPAAAWKDALQNRESETDEKVLPEKDTAMRVPQGKSISEKVQTPSKRDQKDCLTAITKKSKKNDSVTETTNQNLEIKSTVTPKHSNVVNMTKMPKQNIDEENNLLLSTKTTVKDTTTELTNQTTEKDASSCRALTTPNSEELKNQKDQIDSKISPQIPPTEERAQKKGGPSPSSQSESREEQKEQTAANEDTFPAIPSINENLLFSLANKKPTSLSSTANDTFTEQPGQANEKAISKPASTDETASNLPASVFEKTVPLTFSLNEKTTSPPASCNEKTTPPPASLKEKTTPPPTSSNEKTTTPIASSNEKTTPPPTSLNVKSTPPPTSSNEKTTPPPTSSNEKTTPPLASSNEKTTPSPASCNEKTTPPLASSNEKTTPSPASCNEKTTPPLASSNEKTTPSPASCNEKTTPPPASLNEKTTPPPTSSNEKTTTPLTSLDEKTRPPPASSDEKTTPPPAFNNETSTPPSASSNKKATPPPASCNKNTTPPPDSLNEKTTPPPTSSNEKTTTPLTSLDEKTRPPHASSDEKTTPPPAFNNETSTPPSASSNKKATPPPASCNKNTTPPPDSLNEKTTPLHTSSNEKTTPPLASSNEKSTPPPASSNEKTTPPPASSNEKSTPPPTSSNEKSTPPPTSSNEKTRPPPASSDEKTTPPPAFNNEKTTPPSALSNKKATPPPASSNEKTRPPPASSDEKTTPPPAFNNEKTTPPSALSNKKATPPPASSNEKTIPSPASCNEKTTPPPASCNEKTTPPPASLNEKTTPPPTSSNEMTMTPLTSLDEKTRPPPASSDEKTTPPPAFNNETSTPPSASSNIKATPPPASCNKNTTPPPDSLNEKSSPPPASCNEKTTPTPVSVKEKTTPLPKTSNEKTTTPLASSNEKSTPPPTSSNEKSMPPPTSSNEKTTPPLASSNEMTMTPLTSLNEKIRPPPASSDEKTTPPTAFNNEKTTPPSALSNKKATPPPASSNEKSTPPPTSLDGKSMPPPTSSNEMATPPLASSNEKTTPPPVPRNEKTTPPPASSNEKSMPPPTSSDEKTTPSLASSNEKTTPPPVPCNEKTTPPLILTYEKTTPPQALSNEKTIPSSTSPDEKTTPSIASLNEKITPSPTLMNEKNTPHQVSVNEVSHTLASASEKSPFPLSPIKHQSTDQATRKKEFILKPFILPQIPSAPGRPSLNKDSLSSWLDVDHQRPKRKKQTISEPKLKLSSSVSETNLHDNSGEFDPDDFIANVKRLAMPFSLPKRKHNQLRLQAPPFAMPAIREDRCEKPFDPEEFQFGLRRTRREFTLDMAPASISKSQNVEAKEDDTTPKQINSERKSIFTRSLLFQNTNKEPEEKNEEQKKEGSEESKTEPLVRSRLERCSILSSLRNPSRVRRMDLLSPSEHPSEGPGSPSDAPESSTPQQTHTNPTAESPKQDKVKEVPANNEQTGANSTQTGSQVDPMTCEGPTNTLDLKTTSENPTVTMLTDTNASPSPIVTHTGSQDFPKPAKDNGHVVTPDRKPTSGDQTVAMEVDPSPFSTQTGSQPVKDNAPAMTPDLKTTSADPTVSIVTEANGLLKTSYQVAPQPIKDDGPARTLDLNTTLEDSMVTMLTDTNSSSPNSCSQTNSQVVLKPTNKDVPDMTLDLKTSVNPTITTITEADGPPPLPSFDDIKLPSYVEKLLPKEPETFPPSQRIDSLVTSVSLPDLNQTVKDNAAVSEDLSILPASHPSEAQTSQDDTPREQPNIPAVRGFHRRPGKIVLFEHHQFSGQSFEFYRDVPDATHLQLSSVISVKVLRGCWILFEKPGFEGRCIALEEESIIELPNEWAEEAGQTCTPMIIGSIRLSVRDYTPPRIELFMEPSGMGRNFLYVEDTEEVGSFGLPQNTSSIKVHSGLWMVYSDPGFQGLLSVLEVGEYPIPESWGFPSPMVGSLRALRMGVLKVENSNGVKAVLYEKAGLTGRCVEVQGDVFSFRRSETDHGDLDGHGLRCVESLKIVGGLWVGYEREGFEGQQFVLEEGEYLDWRDWGGMCQRLLSLRPVITDVSSAHMKMFNDFDFGERGGNMDLLEPLENTADTSFGPHTCSIDVLSGVWVAFEDPGFSGQLYVLEKGLYGSPEDWGASNSRISSVMPVTRENLGGRCHFKIQLFSEAELCGTSVLLDDSLPTMPDGFTMRSCRVLAGSWLAFAVEGFSGPQCVLEEGVYPDLRSMGFTQDDASVMSLQPTGHEFTLPSIGLFERSGLKGRRTLLKSSSVNLQFTDSCTRVSSILVEGGMWVLYESNNFRGSQFLLRPGVVPDWSKLSDWPRIRSLRPLIQKQAHFRLWNKEAGLLMSITGQLGDIKLMRIQATEETGGMDQIWLYRDGHLQCMGLVDCCVDVGSGVPMAGSRAVLSSEPGQSQQLWNITADGLIRNNAAPNLVLEVKGGQQFNKTQIILNEFNPNKMNQRWSLEIL